jgi:Na+/proline symporter
LFRNQYGKQVELLSAAFMLLTFFGYIAAQLVALGLLLQLLTGLSLSTGILLSAGIVTLYTLAGGMWAISVTDFAQGLLILLGLGVATVLVVQEAGGLPTVLQNAPEQQFRLLPAAEPRAWLHYLAAWMTLGLGSLSSQDLFQRMNSSKSEAVAVQSFYLGAFLYLLIATIPLLLVLAAQQIYPQLLQGDMQQVLIRIIQHSMPLWVQILFFGALLSAILSTCSGAILAPASILSENLLRPLLRHRLNDRQFLLLLRSSVVVMAAAGTSMALWRNNIFELVAESSILGLVTLLVPMTAAVFFPKRSPARAAIASMFSGIAVWWCCQYLFQTEYPAMLYGFGASALAQWAFRGKASVAVAAEITTAE